MMKNHHIIHSSEIEELEKAVQSEKKRFAELLLKAPEMIAVLKGEDFVFEMATPGYLQLINKKDITGKTLKEVLPGLEDQGVLKLLEKVYQTGQPFSVNEIPVKTFTTGNGKQENLYLNFLCEAYKNTDDEVDGLFFFANNVTEQVQARKQLEESEKRYRQIVETSQEGIWMIDKNNLTTFVNKKLCEILEYTAAEMIGKENTFFMDEEGKEIAANAANNRIPGTNEKIDIPLLTKSARKVWVTLAGAVVYENGQYKGGLAMVTDITERKKAEKKLIQSEELFRALIENTHDAIIMYDKDFLTLYRSPSATRMMGYTNEDRLEKKFNAEIHKDDAESFKEYMLKISENPGKALPFICRTKHKAGHYIWIEGVTTNLLNNKSVNAIVSNFRNITDKKLAEETLHLKEQRFRSLIENSEDLLTLINARGNVTYASPSVERILGYTIEEAENQNPLEIIHPDDKQIAERQLQKVFKDPGKPIQLEIRNRKKDGSYIWLSGTITNMLHVPGVKAIVANTRDITQRKIAEDLTRKNGSLLAEAQHIAKYGNWNLDLVSGNVTWSEELYNVFGMMKEPYGQTFDSFIEVIDEEDRDFVVKTSLHTQLTGEPFDIEYRITTSEGEKRIIHDLGYAEYDAQGKVLRLYGTAQNITERKKAEEELIKEKNLSDSIINSLTGIFYLLDTNGNFLRWNKNAENVLGYSNEEISNLHAMNLFDDDEKDFIAQKIEEVFSKGKAEAEACLLSKNGDKIPYFFKASAAEFEGKLCLIGMAIDITERKKAEATIKASEAKFRAFFENSMDAILFSTTDGQVLEANPAAREIFGITEIDICTAKTSKFIDARDQRLQKLLEERQATGRSKGEITMLHTDGTWFPCEIASVNYKDAFQEERVSMIIRDITERKLAEKRLLQINERYKLATRATSNAIWDWNLVTGETFWSEGYEQTFGYNIGESPESFAGWAAKIHPHDFQRVHNGILKIISENKDVYWEDEYRFVKADGTIAYVYNRGNVVYDNQNKPARFVGAMQDNTLRKEIETERELLIKELMKTNADLKQFSYITSHNLRAPLSNITAILNIIDYPALDASNFELLKMLRASCKQLNTTIDDLSDILIIKNNTNIETTAINIEAAFTEIKKTFATELNNIDADIFTDFRVSDVTFYKPYLESIFINLISNAIKYRSPDRKLVIQISSAEAHDGNCVLTFSDNGVGIDLKRHKSKVFGLYQRFHDEIEGYGLGLFIIKSQIMALGGNIEIESEVDKGTFFIITFKKKL